MNDSWELGEDDTGTIHKTNGKDRRTLGMSFCSHEKCIKNILTYILHFVIHNNNHFICTFYNRPNCCKHCNSNKNSSESKNYLKQVAQSLGQVSNNMLEESNDEILQQMHDKMAEVLKAIESGETMIAHFASTKSLAEELMQTHAKQPK